MKLAEDLEERSGGVLQCDVYTNNALGGELDILDQARTGTVEIIYCSPTAATMNPKINVFDLPFLFENSEQVQKLCDSDVGKEMLASLDDIGIKGLGFMEYGMRNITNSKLPIEKPEDLQGIKIRTMENQTQMCIRDRPGGQRPLHVPQAAFEGAQAGTQGVPAVRGLFAGAGECVRAGQHRRSSGVLRCGGTAAPAYGPHPGPGPGKMCIRDRIYSVTVTSIPRAST